MKALRGHYGVDVDCRPEEPLLLGDMPTAQTRVAGSQPC